MGSEGGSGVAVGGIAVCVAVAVAVDIAVDVAVTVAVGVICRDRGRQDVAKNNKDTHKASAVILFMGSTPDRAASSLRSWKLLVLLSCLKRPRQPKVLTKM